MKILKIIYYISVSLSCLILLLYLFIPYGGLSTIYNILKQGLFRYQVGLQVISLNAPAFDANPAAQNLQLMNSIIGITYFLLLGLCVGSLFILKRNPNKKYKVGIFAFITALFLTLGGSILWKYLVKTYVGI